MSWIHRDDWIGLARWLLTSVDAGGPINATAPAPETNEAFAATLARVLRRPHLLRAPRFALRLALGEMADAALLAGQRVVPGRAQALGFRFRWPALEPALRELLRR
jgi:NAD dependent epimerase/dehydratase family enzyme